MKSILLSTIFIAGFTSYNANADFFGLFKGKKEDKIKEENKIDDKTKDENSKSEDKTDKKEEKDDKKVESKGEKKQDKKEVAKTQDKSDSESTDTEINKEDDKDNSKVAIKFKDGTKINRSVILEDLNEVAGQYQQKMSFNDLMLLFEFKHAYEKVVTDEAKKKKLHEDEEVKKSLKERQKATATFSFLSENIDKLMTKKELEKFYDDMWEKHIKGTNQISLILVQVTDEKIAEKIKKEVKSEKDLNKVINEQKEHGNNNIAMVPIEDFPEVGALPPEIVKEMKDKGANSIIGPFPIQPGVFTLFFVKSFHKAQKKAFSDEMVPQMKQAAYKEFSNRYVNSLVDKYKVEVYDLNENKIDFKVTDKEKNKDKKKNKQIPMLSKVKETQVIAKIGDKQTITIADLYKMFNVKSLDNEIFGSLAVQLKIDIEDVIQNAIRLCVQDKLLSLEIEKENYMESDKMKKMCDEVEKQHLRNAYFAKTVKITKKDAEKEYNKYIKMIKPEEGDDIEISVKLMFYKTEKEAEAAIKEYAKNQTKFGNDFKARSESKDRAILLNYVKRQEVSDELWKAIKTCRAGTIATKSIKVDGKTYGFDGNNFVVAYVGDRRPIQLPTFEQTAQTFKTVAEKMQAIAICDELLLNNVVSIDGKQYKALPEEVRHKLLITIIQGDNRTEQSGNE